MTHFKNYKPFMAYLTQTDIDRIKAYSKKSHVPMAQLVREGVASRIAGENMYSEGYNDGITKCISLIHDMRFAQMRFPSGASFAETVENELVKHMWKEPKEDSDEESRNVKESM